MNHLTTTELTKVPFCAIDFETTQITEQPGELAIIEIGAQHFTEAGVQGVPYETLVHPKCKIRPFDTGISGISDKTVIDQPSFKDIYANFFSYIGGRILVAHNAPFDQRALRSQCQRDEIDEPENTFIDSAALLKKTLVLPIYNLHEAVLHFNLTKKPLHRALGDSLVVAELFMKILNNLRAERGISSLGQLYDLLGIKIIHKAEQISLFQR
ncbi:MAG: 3'-5' exonuclease [Patescibacteria group bacterium]